MKLRCPWILGIVLVTGCTHDHLRHGTLRTANTLPDLQYKQVLNNLAMFSENPSAIPYFAVVGTGTIQVTDRGQAATEFAWTSEMMEVMRERMLGFEAERQLAEQWEVAPVTSPDKLKAMRCLYQVAVTGRTSDCYDCSGAIQASFTSEKDRCPLPRCWFHVGGKKDVPRDASFVGRYGHTYVWVMPDGVDALARFTFAMLDIATEEDEEGPLEVIVQGQIPGADASRVRPEGTRRKDFYNPRGLRFVP